MTEKIKFGELGWLKIDGYPLWPVRRADMSEMPEALKDHMHEDEMLIFLFGAKLFALADAWGDRVFSMADSQDAGAKQGSSDDQPASLRKLLQLGFDEAFAWQADSLNKVHTRKRKGSTAEAKATVPNDLKADVTALQEALDAMRLARDSAKGFIPFNEKYGKKTTPKKESPGKSKAEEIEAEKQKVPETPKALEPKPVLKLESAEKPKAEKSEKKSEKDKSEKKLSKKEKKEKKKKRNRSDDSDSESDGSSSSDSSSSSSSSDSDSDSDSEERRKRRKKKKKERRKRKEKKREKKERKKREKKERKEKERKKEKEELEKKKDKETDKARIKKEPKEKPIASKEEELIDLETPIPTNINVDKMEVEEQEEKRKRKRPAKLKEMESYDESGSEGGYESTEEFHLKKVRKLEENGSPKKIDGRKTWRLRKKLALEREMALSGSVSSMNDSQQNSVIEGGGHSTSQPPLSSMTDFQRNILKRDYSKFAHPELRGDPTAPSPSLDFAPVSHFASPPTLEVQKRAPKPKPVPPVSAPVSAPASHHKHSERKKVEEKPSDDSLASSHSSSDNSSEDGLGVAKKGHGSGGSSSGRNSLYPIEFCSECNHSMSVIPLSEVEEASFSWRQPSPNDPSQVRGNTAGGYVLKALHTVTRDQMSGQQLACPIVGCNKSFPSLLERQFHHATEHLQDIGASAFKKPNSSKLSCPYEGCTMSFDGAKARTELRHHIETRHLKMALTRCGQCERVAYVSIETEKKPFDLNAAIQDELRKSAAAPEKPSPPQKQSPPFGSTYQPTASYMQSPYPGNYGAAHQQPFYSSESQESSAPTPSPSTSRWANLSQQVQNRHSSAPATIQIPVNPQPFGSSSSAVPYNFLPPQPPDNSGLLSPKSSEVFDLLVSAALNNPTTPKPDSANGNPAFQTPAQQSSNGVVLSAPSEEIKTAQQ